MWVNEGLATHLESSDHTWISKVLAAADDRIALADLEGEFGQLDTVTALVAYAESAVAARLLVERLGPNLGVFLQMLGSGHTVDQALGTFGVAPESFHAEWRTRVGVRP
jgi:hypothetical protein